MYEIGILGGMGPLATSMLLEMIISRTYALCDQDHLNIIVANKSQIPDRTKFLLDPTETNPLPKLIEGIKELNKLNPRIVLIPCNTSHYFIKELQNISAAPIINMVQNTTAYIKQSDLPKSVVILGTLGTVKTRIYEIFDTCGLNIEYPQEEECQKINDIIYLIKYSGEKVLYQCAKKLTQIINGISSRSTEQKTFILGCTELSALNQYILGNRYKIVDAMELLALSAILQSGKKVQNHKKYSIDIISKNLI
ncbi:hypothetical protein B5G34_16255 [Flavonifractor sp. An82]|uniref:aspartate/glutamate racemase family protein n=1 Tax=Flavonifractor sp. An82 TaxID=1965660 RepID=UPI000B3941E0|nr:amino acid racemase [Flavonifractor sp. An82]OUN20039.1 hypothetical protein B5G34_16255 [Flavonifractor sp. An82]